MASLSPEDRHRLLRSMLISRHTDLREQNLNRQGKGHFHVSGMGHEGLAAIALLLEKDDYLCPYYRDRGLVVGRGVTIKELALEYMAKRRSSSGGRQMPSHYSDAQLHLWSVPTPTGSQLLPACGMAWGMKLDRKPNVVIATVGDAATRQGDFFEAISFARERKLPVMFVVEDNGYGISTFTRNTNPLVLGILDRAQWSMVEGRDVEEVHAIAANGIRSMRAGDGPVFLWVTMERLSSHTSSDDQKLYRSEEELSHLEEGDPLKWLKDRMIADRELSPEEYAELDTGIKEEVRREYQLAEADDNPSPFEVEANVFRTHQEADHIILPPGKYRIGDTINKTLRAALEQDKGHVIFGEDVEDPKGGVFTLTRRLSTDFPEQVFNSPLAESTILGVACGLASYGKRPIFELQFIDFIYPGWNQLVTNLATLRWRSFGKWTCPAVIYAPYGAYLPGGSLWHSQANESAIAHFPGINVVVPSTPEDAAGLLWSAMHADDPVIFLIPKHLLWAERTVTEPVRAVPLGKARLRKEGHDVTVVAWGNTVEKSLEAVEQLGPEMSIELLDLRSIVPWDHKAVEESVSRTRRLVVVQEDTENCSVGQMIISHLCAQPEIWKALISPPLLVSKGNVMIGYNPIYEYAALPDSKRIVAALRESVKVTAERQRDPAVPKVTQDSVTVLHYPTPEQDTVRSQTITVPIMGEGIRSAKVVALLKKPGETIALDEALCELETDKAVYPVESAFAGRLVEWKVKVNDVAEIGQELAVMQVMAPSLESQFSEATVRSGIKPIEPALSPAITRRLEGVISANLQLDVLWGPIKSARAGNQPPSPSAIIAWCIVRAIELHPPLRRAMDEKGELRQLEDFDLGVAVSLPEDRLATAIIPASNRLNWQDFLTAYEQAIAAVRGGKIESVQAPVLITSLGGHGVLAATPIVVPPSIATVFIGSAHPVLQSNHEGVQTVEAATLSLTFDHRVVNGAGAAGFLQEVRKMIETFELPRKAV